MKKPLIRATDLDRLRANHRKQLPVKGTRQEIDFEPIVLVRVLFSPCVWLLTELDEDDVFFGLADLGFGTPELGSVWQGDFDELRAGGFAIQQDESFQPRMTIGAYARKARENQRVVL